MGKSQETYNKKEVRSNKEKKRKGKELKRLAKKENKKSNNLEDMFAYVDENGNLTSTPPDVSKKKDIKLENILIKTSRQDSLPKSDPIRKGTVTFFNESKGYGFIKDLETQESVFVHVNNLLEEIKENNIVSFELEMGQKGPAATHVKLFREKTNETQNIVS